MMTEKTEAWIRVLASFTLHEAIGTRKSIRVLYFRPLAFHAKCVGIPQKSPSDHKLGILGRQV